MRLIDADDLIKRFLDHNRTEFENKNCCMANENVIAIITNAPTVVNENLTPERSQGEWIPVSERLPKEGNTSYLVTVDYGGITCSCQRFFFNDEIGWNDDSVIAWQPLPEPYKKGGKEE